MLESMGPGPVPAWYSRLEPSHDSMESFVSCEHVGESQTFATRFARGVHHSGTMYACAQQSNAASVAKRYDMFVRYSPIATTPHLSAECYAASYALLIRFPCPLLRRHALRCVLLLRRLLRAHDRVHHRFPA